MMAEQCVYVIGPEGGPFKVGIASDVQRRLAALQAGHPERLGVWHELKHPRAAVVEARVHAALTAHRLSGEWFRVALADIVAAIRREVAAERRGRPGATTIINVKNMDKETWARARRVAKANGETMGSLVNRAVALGLRLRAEGRFRSK